MATPLSPRSSVNRTSVAAKQIAGERASQAPTFVVATGGPADVDAALAAASTALSAQPSVGGLKLRWTNGPRRKRTIQAPTFVVSAAVSANFDAALAAASTALSAPPANVGDGPMTRWMSAPYAWHSAKRPRSSVPS